MSYYFEMSFSFVSGKEEALEKFHKAAKLLTESGIAAKYIEKNAKYLRHRLYNTDDNHARSMIADGWIYQLFNLRCVYWEDFGLAAIIGRDYPNCIQELFPFSHEFQNSCDQDYDFDTWDCEIPIFKNIVEAIKVLDENELDEDYSDKDYVRRSLVYQTVYKTLELDDWLWGKDNPIFERYACSGITSQEKQLELYLMMMANIKKEND